MLKNAYMSVNIASGSDKNGKGSLKNASELLKNGKRALKSASGSHENDKRADYLVERLIIFSSQYILFSNIKKIRQVYEV